jgi:hypothetical protein
MLKIETAKAIQRAPGAALGTRAVSVRETQQKTLAQSRGRLTIFIKRLRDLPLKPGNRKKHAHWTLPNVWSLVAGED